MKDEDQTWCILMIRGLEAERKDLSRIGCTSQRHETDFCGFGHLF
jgi:hypothetical protein